MKQKTCAKTIIQKLHLFFDRLKTLHSRWKFFAAFEQHSKKFCFQVIYLKGEKTSDMIVLDPRWLCGSICGHFLSPQFTSQAR